VSILLLVVMFLSACRHQPTVAYLSACNFCGDSGAKGVMFPGTDIKSNKSWSGKTCFEDAFFGDTADFTGITFPDTAVFTDASFSVWANFTHDIFGKAVYFDDVSFANSTNFEYARFPRYAKFTDLQATDSVSIYFSQATLPDTIDFSQNPALKCNIDFSSANFDDSSRLDSTSGVYYRPHYIFLFNTDISKFKLDYFHFRLLVPDYTLTPSSNDGRHQRISNDQKEVMYEALLNNFNKNGQDESYKRLDIEYQTFKWKNSWKRGFVWLGRLWWNFGYDKEYVIAWIILSLFAFSVINCFCLPMLNDNVYEVINPKKMVDLSRRRRIWYSVQYTANIFFRLTLERDCMRFEKFFPTLYFFVIYILGVLCFGYLANFILQK
jgi:hypothetical protein